MARRMTGQRDKLHAFDDLLGAAKRVPLTGLDVRRCDGLRTLEERLGILRRLGSDFRRQPKVAFSLRDRKSTRLNSSHQIISYAVFCLKKKKRTHQLCYLPGLVSLLIIH